MQKVVDQQTLTEQNLHVPAAHWIDAHESKIINVPHNQSNLVAVRVEQDRRTTTWVHGREDISMNVGGDLSGELGRKRAHDVLHTLFDPGCSGSLKQVSEKLIGHIRDFSQVKLSELAGCGSRSQQDCQTDARRMQSSCGSGQISSQFYLR